MMNRTEINNTEIETLIGLDANGDVLLRLVGSDVAGLRCSDGANNGAESTPVSTPAPPRNNTSEEITAAIATMAREIARIKYEDDPEGSENDFLWHLKNAIESFESRWFVLFGPAID